MTERKKLVITVLGGDKRQKVMVRVLAEHGFFVRVWGLRGDWEGMERVVSVADWKDAVNGAHALILPLPASTDGVRIHAPDAVGDGLRLDVLLAAVPLDCPVLGGRLPDATVSACSARGVFCVDYYQNESLQLKNALLTAEGAIELAMQALPVALYGTHMAVIGYGRIGELLSQRLMAFGARVTVYARRQEVLTRASLAGCNSIGLWRKDSSSTLCALARDTRMVFNTVPEWLFSSAVVQTLPPNCIYMELASAPGGIDRAAAQEAGIPMIWGNSLPGKYAPESAGKILAETVAELLREHLPNLTSQ
ncbi:MAG: dipicolinate synthase [Clostridia bacterium]|nr:dipicolinate synthase [Clostridia bacterium]